MSMANTTMVKDLPAILSIPLYEHGKHYQDERRVNSDE